MPGNKGRPRSISPRMQPRLHMSTPGVYLVWGWVWSWRGHSRGRGAGGRRDYEWVLGLEGQEGQGPWLGRGARGP